MENEKNIVLSVRDLTVAYSSGDGAVRAVNGVSFELKRGQTLGLVGETGAGKTTIAKALLRILPDHAVKEVSGQVLFNGEDLLTISESAMRRVRGKQISMIFQDPMTALNPVKTVAKQITEGIQIHQNLSKADALREAIKMLEMVGITEDRANEYPHQFSGGMKQRVVIAMALACNPELLIADEPTTALDVTIQAQVLDLIRNLQKQFHTSMILITHDLGVVAETCDSVAVVYGGKIVECGPLQEVFLCPKHPYTKGLFSALPDLNHKVRRLSPIHGLPPDPTNLPEGCSFQARCPYVTDACKKTDPVTVRVGFEHDCCCCNIPSEECEDTCQH